MPSKACHEQWGAWHLLMSWESDSFLGTTALALLVARLFAWQPACWMPMVWVYDRTGSLLLPVLMHARLTASTSIRAVPATGASLVAFVLAWAAAWWVVVAVVAATSGGQLSRRPGSPPAWPERMGAPHAA